MTDKQAERDEILIRLDELDRTEHNTTDSALLEYIARRKKALRARLETL